MVLRWCGHLATMRVRTSAWGSACELSTDRRSSQVGVCSADLIMLRLLRQKLYRNLD